MDYTFVYGAVALLAAQWLKLRFPKLQLPVPIAATPMQSTAAAGRPWWFQALLDAVRGVVDEAVDRRLSRGASIGPPPPPQFSLNPDGSYTILVPAPIAASPPTPLDAAPPPPKAEEPPSKP